MKPLGHRVTKRDQKRIWCQHGGISAPRCGAPAVWCEHAPFNASGVSGISFFYYCAEHRAFVAPGLRGPS